MFVPFFSKPSERSLVRRKGGGGGGGGGRGSSGGGRGSSGSSGGGKSGGSGKSGTGGSSSGRSSTISSSGSSKSARSYGGGGGKASTIPTGQLFAGRVSGGGTRSQVYGNGQYGSGYPGVSGRGVAGRGFPFIFWPLAWGGIAGVGTAAYLHSTEYGRYDNSSRPGGIMMTAAFASTALNNTFRLVADNSTVTSLIQDIVANCSSLLSSPSSIVATNYSDSLTVPKPEQAIQYYRASSVALTLDSYNDTGALAADGTPDTPLPTTLDTNLLNCLNFTIGEAVPLVDGAGLRFSMSPAMGLFGLVYLLWTLLSSI